MFLLFFSYFPFQNSSEIKTVIEFWFKYGFLTLLSFLSELVSKQESKQKEKSKRIIFSRHVLFNEAKLK